MRHRNIFAAKKISAKIFSHNFAFHRGLKPIESIFQLKVCKEMSCWKDSMRHRNIFATKKELQRHNFEFHGGPKPDPGDMIGFDNSYKGESKGKGKGKGSKGSKGGSTFDHAPPGFTPEARRGGGGSSSSSRANLEDDFPTLGGGGGNSGGFGGPGDFAGNDFPDFPPMAAAAPKAQGKKNFDPRGADRPTTTGTYNKPNWQSGQGGFGTAGGASSSSSTSGAQNNPQPKAGGGQKKTKAQKKKEMMNLLQGR
jgi:hypothetical protein